MEMELRIVGDSFSTFDPDREIDAVLSRIHSSKISLVLKYWLGQRKGPRLPASADIDPAAIKSALPHVMITGISYDPFRVLYRLVGTEIVRWARVDFTNRYADELIFQDDGRDWTDYYRAVVAARQPAFGVTDWAESDGPPYWAEFLICPLPRDRGLQDHERARGRGARAGHRTQARAGDVGRDQDAAGAVDGGPAPRKRRLRSGPWMKRLGLLVASALLLLCRAGALG